MTLFQSRIVVSTLKFIANDSANEMEKEERRKKKEEERRNTETEANYVGCIGPPLIPDKIVWGSNFQFLVS